MTAIPDYRVELDAYSGPLDLLLYLVRRDEVDLYDIPIARLTEQYLTYLRRWQQIDVDLAGEFLVMAATLLEIKSALLVPKVAKPEDQETAGPEPADSGMNPLDPRFELVQQLLAYKRFKDASGQLEDRHRQWEARYPVQPPRAQRPPEVAEGELGDGPETAEDPEADAAAARDLDLEDASVLDLCDAFTRIMDTLGEGTLHHEVLYDDTPIGLHADDIVDRLGREGAMTLQAIFVGRSRSEAIGLFLAVLELVRQRRIKAVQDQTSAGGIINLELLPLEDAPETAGGGETSGATFGGGASGGVEYEWPSEQERLRAERRAKLRATRAAKGAFGKNKIAEDEESADFADAADSAEASEGDAVAGEDGGVDSDQPASDSDGDDGLDDAQAPET
jgi:segregation and condensation protein A